MKQIISLQIDSELYDYIKAQADEEGISASAVIRRLLKKHFIKGAYYEHETRQDNSTVRADTRSNDL